jgi:hypothetical protein
MEKGTLAMPRDVVFEECPLRDRTPLPCGCGSKCMRPSEADIRAANEKDYTLTVIGGQVYSIVLGPTEEWYGDGTRIRREHHFDGRPTKVVTWRNGRHKVVTYEKPV